jgi:poly-gamma-glutamate capsule biosynthesis protein CapA/YwtB (metallophosphatase superfamily)
VHDNRDARVGLHVDPMRIERRRLRRRRLRRQRTAAGLSALAAAAVLGIAASGLDLALSSHAALARDGHAAASGSAGSAQAFDIVASGDLLVHGPVWQRAAAAGHGSYDFRPLLAEVRPIVSRAALAICHVETPMGAGPPAGYPVFNSPKELAAAIAWAGWDVCSTASNHSVDKGQYGIGTTLRALGAAGVRHTGSFRTETESRRILMLSVRGLRIAFLSYTYGTNGVPLPHPWSVNLVSTSKIVADARRARGHGAGLVIANMHWGDEYVHEPNTQQRDLARYLLRRRIVDVIVGQHVHVVQPIRRIARRFVVFGEGNLLSNQTAVCCPAESQDGLIAVIHVRVTNGKATVKGVDYVPTYVEHPSFIVQPVAARLAELVRQGRGQSALARALRLSYRRTVGYAGRSARIHPVRSPGSIVGG